MFNLRDFKDLLLNWVSVIKRILRGHVVEKPRFTYVTDLQVKTGGPDPESFGSVYRDEQGGKEYLVKSIFAPKDGKDHFAVFDVNEIVARPENVTRFDEGSFDKHVTLKRADPDVEETLISFFEKSCREKGRVFVDKRIRQASVRGTGRPDQTHTFG